MEAIGTIIKKETDYGCYQYTVRNFSTGLFKTFHCWERASIGDVIVFQIHATGELIAIIKKEA